MKNILTLILVFFLANYTLAQKLNKEYDALMSEVYKEDGPGAVALVVQKGKVLYRRAFGMANLELGVKMKPENVFRIGSITKQFTASAILRLRDEGKLRLDDDITKYISKYPTHGHAISIEHLLTHTSGIRSYTEMKEWDAEVQKKDFTPTELIAFFKNQPMDFKPGEEFHYNNSAYFILGYIIEVVSGKSYEEYIDSVFFKPLKMTNSYYDSSSRIIKNRAYGYNKNEDDYMNQDFLNMTQPYAAGSLLSSVDDLYKWYSAVMNDEVISETSRKEAHTPHLLNDGQKTGYGYGWFIGNIQGSKMIEHGGGINGYLTSSIYLPDDDVFVAVFTNCTCDDPDKIAKKIAAITIGKPYEWKKMKVDEDLLTEYEAVYKSENGEQRIITLKNSQLYSMRSGVNKFEIYPFEKDKFFFQSDADGVSTLHFVRASNNEIISVISKSTGYDIEWKRTKEPIPTLEKIDLDDSITNKYVGKYELASNFMLSIFKEKDQIFIQATGQNRIEIIPFEENKFRLVDVDAKLTFNMDENGIVTSLTLHQEGDSEAKKIE
ncbi:serine hydrolase [Arenibacter palladensis]|uniref:serine hydrolase n=1 Tax=Arenibacter palladensis TaxID=237373 RepID=UPI002FCE8FA7